VTTRTGDGGRSSDYSGRQDWKDSAVFGVLGDIDELSSWLGLVKAEVPWRRWRTRAVETAQRKLQTLGSQVATAPGSPEAERIGRIPADDVDEIEGWERRLLDHGVAIKPVFVLPGATRRSAETDVARTVCRRAERSLVGFIRTQGRPDLQRGALYLNRLSDFLFLLARNRE